MIIDGWQLKDGDDLLQRDLEAFEAWLQGNPHPVIAAFDEQYERLTLDGALTGRSRQAAAKVKAARLAGIDGLPDGDVSAMRPGDVRKAAQDVDIKIAAMRGRHTVQCAVEAGWFTEHGDAGDLPDDHAVTLLMHINTLYADVTRIPEKKF